MAEFDKSIFLKQFQEEATEHLQILDQGFMELEKDPENRQVLDQVFRSAHTLKGTSAMLGLHSIKELAHALEDLLQKARDREIVLTSAHIDLLLETLDYLKIQVEQAREGKEPELITSQIEKLRAIPSKREAESLLPHLKEEPHTELTQAKSASVSPLTAAPGESIRVEVNKLDTLLNLTGELTISRSRLYEILRELRRVRPHFERIDEALKEIKEWQLASESSEELREVKEEYRLLKEKVSDCIEKLFEAQGRVDQYASRIQEGVMQIRMLPISTIFATFPRIVRDACRQTGKKVDLKMQGSDTELDKRIIDEIGEPLLHLLRNAVDHGIEMPEQRKASGKPEIGSVEIRAYARGNQVIVEVADDGQGIDKEAIKKKAVAKKIITEEEALSLEQDEQVFSLLFLPGFSTKDEATALSGRGVGLDVVKDKIEKLKGSIELLSEPQRGSRFIIRLPLTLSLTEVIMVREAQLSFAIPLANIEEMVLISPEEIQKVGDKEAVPIRHELVPIIRLGHLLRLPVPTLPSKFYPAVVVGQGEKKLAIWVEELKGKQEIVIKSFGAFYPRVENLAGATILGSGEIVPILDVLHLMQRARTAEKEVSAVLPLQEKVKKKRILVVEDSLVAREAEKSILEMANYEVVTAVDGEEALKVLNETPPDLVVTDIAMPRMDGFTLLAHIRNSEKLQNLPVIIVTTRDSEEDKRKGIELGADRYVVKGEFQQEEILATIKSLLG